MIYKEDQESISAILNHKYSCTDKSITAKLILKHYWNFMMLFIPKWIAPNILSLLGLIMMVLSVSVTLIINPSLDAKEQHFLHLINALLLFIYSTFDSIDGRQAVRTNSCSPLGQMVDHGVDSLVATLQGITLASSLGLGMNYQMVLLISFVYIGFYLTTIHEKMTEKFYLGYINGPTEGIMLMVLLHLISFFKGPSFFSILTDNYFTFCNNFMILIISLFLIYLIYFFYDLFLTIGHKTEKVIKQLFFIFLLCFFLYRITEYYSFIFFYLTLFTVMFIFSYITIDLIFSRTKNTEIPLPPFSYYFFILFGIGFNYFNDYFKKVFSVGLFVFTTVSYFMKVYSVSWVVSDFLNLRIFLIKDKQNKKDN